MIIVAFQGGFANQIFQYAFYLKLQEDFSSEQIFADISHYKNCHDHGGFKLNNFVSLNYFNGNRDNLNYFLLTEYNFFDVKISENTNYFAKGYWQDTKFFPKDLSNIYKIFAKENLNIRNQNTIQQILQTESVSIHVRRGDYVNNYMHGNIANKTYYQNSIDYINSSIKNPVFFVFSDDINWCKSNLNFNNQVYYVEGNDKEVEQDIILMSNCKHNIISNSSFSWWASYLNKNENKTIITPEYWFNQKTESVAELKVLNSTKLPNTPKVLEKSEDPFFTIVIPVYNTASTLRRTLASVLNQTYSNIEVVIVNDKSPDNSAEIIKDYCERDRRINYVENAKNESLLAARVIGMKNGHGKYFLFLDSDDWLELNACELLFNKLNNTEYDALEFGYIREPARYRNPIEHSSEKRIDAIFQNKYSVTVWNKAYSKNVIQKLYNSFDSFYATFAEDAFFSVLISYFTDNYGYLDEYLHHYSISTGISTQSDYKIEKIEKICADCKAIKENLIKFFEKNDKEKLQFIDGFIKERLNFIYHLATQTSNIPLLLKSLLVIDNNFKTNYFDNYVLEQDKIVKRYEEIRNLSLFKKFLFITKYILKKFKRKLFHK